MIWKKHSVLQGVAGLIVLANVAVCSAWVPGRITDVRLSSDLKRIVISAEGSVSQPAAFRIQRPSKLVIDFKGAALGTKVRNLELTDKPIRRIRPGKLKSGARIVVDFGGYEVPEYRIRRMENCFMVFFGEYRRSELAAPPEPRAVTAAKKGASRDKKRWEPVPAAKGGTGLLIKSAKVVGNEIVLEVASKSQPGSRYRVDLGIDLDQLGFNSANIRKVVATESEQTDTGPARPAGDDAKKSHDHIKGGPPKESDGMAKPGPTRAGRSVSRIRVEQDCPARPGPSARVASAGRFVAREVNRNIDWNRELVSDSDQEPAAAD